jgi:hypothetical protein
MIITNKYLGGWDHLYILWDDFFLHTVLSFHQYANIYVSDSGSETWFITSKFKVTKFILGLYVTLFTEQSLHTAKFISN